MVLQAFVHIEGVEVFGVEAGQEHVDDDGDVDLLLPGHILSALPLDALLHVAVVAVKLLDTEVPAVGLSVNTDDTPEGFLLAQRVHLVVLPLLVKLFLYLHDVAVALGWGREEAGDAEGLVGRILLALELDLIKDLAVFDGVVDAGGGKEGIEAAVVRHLVVHLEDLIHDHLFGHFPRIEAAIPPEAVEGDVEGQHALVFNGVGDGVCV